MSLNADDSNLAQSASHSHDIDTAVRDAAPGIFSQGSFY